MDRWEELFQPPDLESIESPRNISNTLKTVLITWAGGCIGSALGILGEFVRGRNLARVSEIISSVVPEYEPSKTLIHAAKNSMVRETT